METQLAFNIILGLASFFGAYILNTISNKIERLDNDLRDLPKLYVTKDENRHDMDEIKQMLQRIFEKLDQKVDRNDIR